MAILTRFAPTTGDSLHLLVLVRLPEEEKKLSFVVTVTAEQLTGIKGCYRKTEEKELVFPLLKGQTVDHIYNPDYTVIINSTREELEAQG